MDDDVFSATVLEKLPLADSVWRLLHFTMDDPWLQDLGTRHRAGWIGQRAQREVLAGQREAVRQHGVVDTHQVRGVYGGKGPEFTYGQLVGSLGGECGENL